MPFGALYFNVNLVENVKTCGYIMKSVLHFYHNSTKIILYRKCKLDKYTEWLWHEAIPKLDLISNLKGKF